MLKTRRSGRCTFVGLVAMGVALSSCASTNQRGSGSTTTIAGILADETTGEIDGGVGVAGGATDTAPDNPTSDASATATQGAMAGGAGDASDSGNTGSGGAGSGQGSTGTSGAGQSGGSSPSGGASPAGGGAGAPAGGGETSGAGSAASDGFVGRGITEDTITIGVQSSADLQAGFAVVGASGDAPDEIAYANAIAAQVNAEGGIRGRKVELVHHETNPVNGSFAAQAQSACATFTEDNEVFAVISSAVGGDDSLLACLAQKGTPLIETNLWVFDKKYYDDNPGLLFQPGRIVADRWVREYVDGLKAIDFFEGAKLGLLRFDAPVFDRLADNVLKPRLAELGIAVEEVVVGSPGGVSDFGGAGAEMASAVLRFQSMGVTHLMMLENAGIMPFFFMQEAENQGYRPVYGLSSTDIPTTQSGQQEPRQLENSVAIGWTPPNDVYHGDNTEPTAQYLRCRKVMEDDGQTNLSGFYIQSRCDGLWFLKAAIEAAPVPSQAGLAKGAAALGSSYQSPFTLGSSFGPGKFDGADVVRASRFHMDCECYRYFGPARKFR